jgi:DNA-binding NtrC family response regulator
MSDTRGSPAPPTTKPLRILYAEHEPDDIELTLRELKKSGIELQAETASTRAEFVRKLREKPFDIILADYRLPGWTGMDALADIKHLGLDIPLILITGTLGEDKAVECFKLGISDYVLKGQLVKLPMAVHRAEEEKSLRHAEARAVEALRESEARYRGLVQNATYGIYWVTVPGELLYVNPALVRMLG